ncbi:MAG: hypothetical protein ACI959_000913, partial [Limisphaerales bacterium]
TFGSLTVAIFSTIVSRRSLKIAEKSADATLQTVDLFKQQLEDETLAVNMELHHSIVQKIRELQLHLPLEISNPDYEPTPDVERKIFVFWFLIFDEWFASKHEGKFLEGYWDKYYTKELKGVLNRSAFTTVLKKMVDDKNITFFGQVEAFSRMLDELYYKENGSHLFDSYHFDS